MESLYYKQGMGSPFFGKKMAQAPGSLISANHTHELPSLDSLREKSVKVGHLKKLCGRGILSPGTWKDRHGLLNQNQLFLYEKQDPDGKEKGIGVVIDLKHFDLVGEAPTRVTRKAANVFFLGTSDKRFFDSSSRHYFATGSESEMKSWVSGLRSSIESSKARHNGREDGAKDDDGRESKKKRKNGSGPNDSGSSPTSLQQQQQQTPEPKMRASTLVDPETIVVSGTLPRSAGPLDCGVAKGRAKGPPGRRLPRSKPFPVQSSRDDLEAPATPSTPFRDDRGRATSLSALEHNYSPPSEDLEGRPETRSAFSPDPPESERVAGESSDFEHAWFLRIPPKAAHSASAAAAAGDEKTSDYSSLHDELSEGTSSQGSSLLGTPLRRDAELEGPDSSGPEVSQSSSTSRKERSRPGKGFELEEAELWKSSESRGRFGGEREWKDETFALAYHYSSSEDDEGGKDPSLDGTDTSSVSRSAYEATRAVSGPQVKPGTQTSLRLSRRNTPASAGGGRGGTPVRHSASMTPPPCLLRKLRREMSMERTRDIELELDDLGSFPDDLNGPCWRRTSSGSSLSTITPEASPYEEEQRLKGPSNGHHHAHQFPPHLTYASLQRPLANGHSNNGPTPGPKKATKNRLSSPTASPRHGNCYRGSSSATASPIINGRYSGNGLYGNGHQWFQHPLERSMETLKKELGAVSQDATRLDMDMSCLRQDVESVQETIIAVRATLETARERAGRLSLQLVNAERQITSAVKETGVLRKEALKVLESAEGAKGLHEQLAEEAEGLLGFLRNLVSSCHENRGLCPSCNTPSPLAQSGPGSTGPFRRGKTPERLLSSIPETKLKGLESEVSGRQRNDSERTESDITSSDNESRSIVESLQKGDYQKS